MRVLLADDSRSTRRAMEAQLHEWGYRPEPVGTGTEAWERLNAPDPPPIALLDWVMPGMDGPSIVRKLRASRTDTHTWVFLVTARGGSSSLLEGLEAGADDYLTKPFDRAELHLRLRNAARVVTLQQELVRARETLRHQAATDVLTRLPNRAAGAGALARELARAARERGALSVLIVDLDHFKMVNDTHGHPAGDEVLTEAARRMAGAIRPYDVIARWGGEEFLLVLPGCTDSSTLIVAERLRLGVCAAPVVVGGVSIPVTCSVGAASVTAPTAADGSAVLIARADRALYDAKRAGRNRVVRAA